MQTAVDSRFNAVRYARRLATGFSQAIQQVWRQLREWMRRVGQGFVFSQGAFRRREFALILQAIQQPVAFGQQGVAVSAGVYEGRVIGERTPKSLIVPPSSQ